MNSKSLQYIKHLLKIFKVWWFLRKGKHKLVSSTLPWFLLLEVELKTNKQTSLIEIEKVKWDKDNRELNQQKQS